MGKGSSSGAGNQGARTWNLTKQPFYHKNRFPERLDSPPDFPPFVYLSLVSDAFREARGGFSVRLAEEKRGSAARGARGGRAHRRL